MPNILSGLMVPAVSTFDAAGDLDRAAFQFNLDAHLAHGVDGVLVAGSSGESALLDDEDRRSLLGWARERIPAFGWLFLVRCVPVLEHDVPSFIEANRTNPISFL